MATVRQACRQAMRCIRPRSKQDLREGLRAALSEMSTRIHEHGAGLPQSVRDRWRNIWEGINATAGPNDEGTISAWLRSIDDEMDLRGTADDILRIFEAICEAGIK